MKRLILSVIAALLVPHLAHAIVDMKNANYADSMQIINVPGGGFDLKVVQYYNSRSIFVGMFGFGWCSDFETTIEKTPEGNLKLQECGAGQEITYTQADFDPKNLEKTIDQVVAYYKKTNQGANKETIETLRQQLHNNAGLRSRWARAANLPQSDVKKGVVYAADHLEVEKVVFDGTYYTRSLADGTSQRFDTAGRLVQLYDKNANFLKLTYTGDLIKEVVDNGGKKLSFTYFPNKRVKEIIGPANIRADYKFKGDLLIELKNMWRNTYIFAYDDTRNLTKISYPDRTFKALTYDQKLDRVLSFTDRVANGVSCIESYNYEVDKQNPRDHFWSTAIKKCGKEVKNEAKFEFWYKNHPDGRKYLSRVLTKSPTDTLDVSYHPDFGRPLSIRRNSFSSTFAYYPNGLIKEKSTATMKMAYEYKNQFNKVSQVLTDFIDPNGVSIRKRDTTFTYDTKANLVYAANSDGQNVRLSYDAHGRIASITDQAKKEVQIKYEERSGKPAVISRPKVGSINVSYKPNGEINKVESPDGPSVAVQVASTFNNLLDIIAPATSELSL